MSLIQTCKCEESEKRSLGTTDQPGVTLDQFVVFPYALSGGDLLTSVMESSFKHDGHFLARLGAFGSSCEPQRMGRIIPKSQGHTTRH
jgi:hypothetical protein